MKKLFTIIILILIAVGLWYLFHRTANVAPEPVATHTTTSSQTKPDPSNATFTFEDGTVSLTKGKSNDPIEGSAATVETSLTDVRAYGDINGDGKDDTAALLTQIGGGSGEFTYLVGYVSGTVTYKGTNAVFIGDRIQPKSITIKNGVVTVNYLDRKEDQSFADEPTINTTKQFVFKNGELVAR
jgi:hypothetical protein